MGVVAVRGGVSPGGGSAVARPSTPRRVDGEAVAPPISTPRLHPVTGAGRPLRRRGPLLPQDVAILRLSRLLGISEAAVIVSTVGFALPRPPGGVRG